MIELHINNLYTKVNKKLASKEELDAISQLLSLKVSGYYFSRMYKMGMWDGTKKFFNRLTGTFYTGLVGYVKSRLPEFEFSEIDERKEIAIQNNCLSLHGIDFWDFQTRAILEAIKQKRGIIASPTNSGKTEIAAGIIKVLGLPANFITHRRRLLWQTKRRFEDRLGFEIGIVGDQVKEIKDVNILSIHTIAKRLKDKDPEIEDLLAKTPVVFSDECHHVSAVSWEKCLRMCSAYYRYGLSATALMRDNISNMTVLGLIGDEIVTVTDEQLTEMGISAFPSVFLFDIDKPIFPKHYPYDKVYEEGVVFNDYQNYLIGETVKLWTSIGKQVLIIVYRLAHGEKLKELINKIGIETEFISGQDKKAKIQYNDEVMDRFAAGGLPCLVSSTISDEGLDIPAIDVLIIAVGDESALKVVQRVGRGRRKKKDGDNVIIVVDFVHTNNRYLKKHSFARLEQYHKMGLKMYEIRDAGWQKVTPLT